MKRKEKPPVKTEESYLNHLGKALLCYFPLAQVREILGDYQEHFSLGRERHGTDEAMIAALGSPETVASDLLREMPEGRSYLCRHTVRWGVLFLLACASLILRYSTIDALQQFAAYFFLLLGSFSAFELLHGPGRAEVEGSFLHPAPRFNICLYLVPVLVVLGLEAVVQWLFQGMLGNVPYLSFGDQLARQTGLAIEVSQLCLTVLLFWSLWRVCTMSVRYFPAVIHTVGALLALREILGLLHSMDISYGLEECPRLFALCLLPYAAGILLAVLFRLYIRTAGERGRSAWMRS